MAVVIAIDAGTTGVRSIAFDHSGRVVGLALPRVRAALPATRLDRARRGRDLGRGAADARPTRGRAGSAGRRHRHHRPARDDGRLGPPHGPARPSGHRLAGPSHGAPLRRAARSGPPRPRAPPDRAGARPVLLGLEDRVAAARGWRRGHARPGVRHDRLVDPLEPHRGHCGRRRRARHRRVQRQPHPAVRHRRPIVVGRAVRAVLGADVDAARGAAVVGSAGADRRGRGRGGRRGPGERHRRRSTGRPVRAGLLRPGDDQEHLRHRVVRADERGRDLPRAGRRPADHHRVDAAGRRRCARADRAR